MDVTLYCILTGVLLNPQVCVQFSSNNLMDLLTMIHKSKIMHIHELIIGRDQGLEHVQIYVVEYIL